MIKRSITGVATVAVVALVTCSVPPGAIAQSGDAAQIVKSMSNYVARQTNLSVVFDSDIEVTTPDKQKIQFSSSGKVLLSRPDKFRATRTGGYVDLEMVFDGTKISLLGKNLNKYVQMQAPGSSEQLVEMLRDRFGLDLPGADLLAPDGYSQLMADVVDAKYIGRGIIDGIECEHVAFRTPDVDWQLWVEVGSRPIPRKYVITSKNVPGSPQYTLRFRDWKSDVKFKAGTFVFKPPARAQQVDIAQMRNIDEVPESSVAGQPEGMNGLSGIGGQQ